MATRGKATVIDRDLGWDYIKAQAKELAKKPGVVVGIRGTNADDKKTFISEDGGKAQNVGGPTLAEIATVHEYGSPSKGIPERSYLRSTVDKNLSSYRQILEQLKLQIFNPKVNVTVKNALLILGAKIKLDVQATIRAGIPPAWADSTREARIRRANPEGDFSIGKDGIKNATIIAETPLIDTGQLVNGITYAVEYKKDVK